MEVADDELFDGLGELVTGSEGRWQGQVILCRDLLQDAVFSDANDNIFCKKIIIE